MTQYRKRIIEAWYQMTPEERAAPRFHSVRLEIRRHHRRDPKADHLCTCGILADHCEALVALEECK